MKWLKRFLFVVVCLVTLYGLFIAVENWRGKHAWDTYQREREARGDSFDWRSVTPPPVPDAENFATTPLFAELFPKPPQKPKLDALRLPDCAGAAGDWHTGRIENLAAWKKNFTNDDLVAALKVYEPMMHEISEALQQRPKCRFPVRYEDHFYALMPHLSPLRNVTRVYRLRALAELSAGQTDDAFEDVRLCLRLADTIKDEPVLISFLVRVALLDMAAQPIWEGLIAHRWNDRQLAVLQAEFANLDQLAGFSHAMRGERLFGYNATRWLIKKPEERRSVLGGFVSSTDQPAMGVLLVRAAPTCWWYQNLLTLDRFHTETYWPALDLQHRQISPPRWQGVEEKFKAKRPSPYSVLSKLILPAITSCAMKTGQSQTTVDEVVVACALERYRIVKGALPDKLDALVPEFLAKVPMDVINGEPLRYRRDAERFTLWSVGWNGKDDGGVVATTKDKKLRWDKDDGDWVWGSLP